MNFNPILFRHHLHRHPELSGKEVDTGLYISKTLEEFGYKPLVGIGGNGVVIRIDSGKPGPNLLFRADFDALPIHEQSNHDHTSCNKGVMHACGHDGHTASLVALAYRLKNIELQRGTVQLVFQPDEETGKGAFAMLNDDQWEPGDINYCFGYHNIPGYPIGLILTRNNTFACASSGVICTFKGKASHAALPNEGICPSKAVYRLMARIEKLPDTLSDGFNLATLVHVNIGEPVFGTTPDKGQLMATLRSDSTKCFERLKDGFISVANSEALQAGLSVDIEWVEPFHATINHSEANLLLRHVCRELGFDCLELEEPMRWSEDFSMFSNRWPSAFFGIGCGVEHPQLHNSRFDFPDALIDISSKVYEKIVKNMNGVAYAN